MEISTFKYVNGITISRYPSIEELLKDHPGKTVEEYLKMQQQYIHNKLAELDKERSDLIAIVDSYKNKSIYLKSVYINSPNITHYIRCYDFYLEESFSITWRVDSMTVNTDSKFFSVEISIGGITKDHTWEHIIGSNVVQNTEIIKEVEFNKVWDAGKNFKEAIKKII